MYTGLFPYRFRAVAFISVTLTDAFVFFLWRMTMKFHFASFLLLCHVGLFSNCEFFLVLKVECLSWDPMRCIYAHTYMCICKKRPNAMWDPMDDCEYTHWVSFYVYTGLIWNVECVWPWNWNALHGLACYGVATISRLLKIIGLFCRILSLL